MLLKSYFQINFFVCWHFKKWLKSDNFDKTSSGGAKRRCSQQLILQYIWQDTCGKKFNLLFISNIYFSGFFWPLKKEQIKNLNEVSPENFINLFWIINFSFIWWATLLTNSSYEPHKTYVSGFTFLLNQEGPKNHNQFCNFCHRGGTNFLVLAQTLIYGLIYNMQISRTPN